MDISVQPLTNQAYGYPRGARRRMTPYVLAVVHQTSNPTANAQQERDYANRAGGDGPSATYYVNRDGSVIAAVDSAYASWCSGDVRSPDTSIPTVARIVADPAHNANEAVWDQFECCGAGPEPWTDEQFEAVAQLIAARAQVTGLPIDRTTVLTHRDLNTIDRASDPWPADRREDRMARLIARANEIAHPQEGPVKITAIKAWGDPIEKAMLQVGSLFLAPANPIGATRTSYGPYPDPVPVLVYARTTLTDDFGAPIDVDGNQPPQNGRELIAIVDAPEFAGYAYALQHDLINVEPIPAPAPTPPVTAPTLTTTTSPDGRSVTVSIA